MLQECLISDYQRKLSMENFMEPQEGKRSQVAQRNATKTPIKPSLKDSNIPTVSWDQAAQDRAKRRQLIRKEQLSYPPLDGELRTCGFA